MIRSSWLKSIVVSVVAIVAVLPAAASRADAQAKPFKVIGAGLAPNGISLDPNVASLHNSIGVGNELGKYYGEGLFHITGPAPVPNPLQASFSSAPYFTFAAANGDLLVCTYGNGGTGLVTLTPVGTGFTARFVAEFNPVPDKCTGRFKGVTGSWNMIAQSGFFTFVSATNTTPFAYAWQGEGTLTFPKSSRLAVNGIDHKKRPVSLAAKQRTHRPSDVPGHVCASGHSAFSISQQENMENGFVARAFHRDCEIDSYLSGATRD